MIRKKFLYKMLIFYFSIILLFTSITSAVILYKGSQLSHLETNLSHQLYTDQASNYADSKFSTALEFIYKMSTLNSLIDYKYSSSINYIYITNLYNDLISYLQGFNTMGFTLGITKITDNMVITPNGTYSCDYYFKEIGIDSDFIPTIRDSMDSRIALNTYVVPKSMMKYPSNKMVLIHQSAGPSKLSPVYFFIIINTNMLLPLTSTEANGDFSIYTDEVISNISNNLDTSNTSISKYLTSLDTKEDINNLKMDSTINYIHHSTVIPNLKYVYSIEPPSIVPTLMSIVKTVLIPVFILFIIGIFIAYKAAQSSYRPIRQLLNFLDGQQNTPHSETDLYDNLNSKLAKTAQHINDFDYIELNIKQLYSLNNQLQNKINNSRLHLQEDFFRKVIYGIAHEEFINENLLLLNLDVFKDHINLILLDCEGIDNLPRLISTQNLSLFIHESIRQLTTDISHFFVLPLDTKKYCIISSNKSKDELCAMCTCILNKMEVDLSLDITAYVSSTYTINQLSLGLQELLTLNNYKYSAPPNTILTSETIQMIKETIYYYPIETEACLINYINTNDFTKAKDLFIDLLDRNLSTLKLSPRDATNLKYSLITTFKRCLNTDGKTLNQFIKEYPKMIDHFIASPTSILKEESITLFETIFNYCNKDKFNLENSTASSIFMYIHKNFDKDISLTDIADNFGLSESYISKLLKSSLDINFKTYVNKLKVNKAKELLNQGNYKVNEVATIVGCNSANTFIRIFKQYEGISPGEYVKSINQLNISK